MTLPQGAPALKHRGSIIRALSALVCGSHDMEATQRQDPDGPGSHDHWRRLAMSARAEHDELRAALASSTSEARRERERAEALAAALRAMVEHDDKLRALCAKRTTSWKTVLDWYRAHPADSDVVAAARASLAAHDEAKGGRP